jgi:hypothetical protein
LTAADGPLCRWHRSEIRLTHCTLRQGEGGQEWANQFKRTAKVDPNDPFHNLTPFEWWSARRRCPDVARRMGERGAEGNVFQGLYNTLQGSAGGGLRLRPEAFTVQDRRGALQRLAQGGQGRYQHTLATLPDWSGDWRDPAQANGFPICSRRRAVSDAYKPRFELTLQAELEGRHWWPADSCVPESFAASGRFLMVTPTMVLMNSTGQYQRDRYVFTDGRGFLPEDIAVQQWLGESQGFWDGDELVVWSKNIKQSARPRCA